MAGMYPDNETLSLFGEEVSWPGVDAATGKFTNGDFSDPMKRPSFIPAETVNLVLDNIAAVISGLGLTPNNTGPDQLLKAIQNKYSTTEWFKDFIFPVGEVSQQLPNTKSPAEKGLPGIWQDCTHRAYAYRLRQTALPAFTAYAPGANYAAGAVVMWHLTGDDWGFFTANRAITNAPWQLDPVMWDQLQNGMVIEQRFLHGYTEDDFEIGQQVASGQYAGFWVEAIFVYGGKFFSATGGNRPTFVSGGVAGDERVTLTIAEMPRHDHQIASSTRSNSDGSGASDLRSGTGWNTGFTGGGQSHNNIPPTIAVRYWRRAA